MHPPSTPSMPIRQGAMTSGCGAYRTFQLERSLPTLRGP
jgi:hypothetical protein